ncbi:hypothetical protein ELQ35_00150 [Peribacillus cavernae]|uniref:Uncharacterized protein n=1 Tax=Peribacillus cavernae TaxID=1674310 RepID=A0A3S0UIT1_9BACI|nr:hypothetical protein [Peribacillus cavernae]MDQ0217888.1 hypothetical protein [Peribacillus cavernae]RUQ32551.1 hypothetical protein ELQ35_00150 [Peribacillus cavernae]
MNIRTYYERTARRCFHVSWLTLIIAVIFFVLHVCNVFEGNIIAITLPFLFLSIAQFCVSRTYENRMKDLPPDNVMMTNVSPLATKDVLLTFLPAPTLRVLLFHPNGSLLGEIRDLNMHWFMWMIPNSFSLVLPKRYLLTNGEGEVLAEYKMKWGIKTVIYMKDNTGRLVGHYRESLKESIIRLKGMIYTAEGQAWMPINVGGLLHNFDIETEGGKHIVSLRKGWMPLEWGTRFKEMNTPILSFDDQAKVEEKIAVFGFCASAFHHRSN